jgi:hypothetical protein
MYCCFAICLQGYAGKKNYQQEMQSLYKSIQQIFFYIERFKDIIKKLSTEKIAALYLT